MRKFPLIISSFNENYQNDIKIKSNNTTKNDIPCFYSK